MKLAKAIEILTTDLDQGQICIELKEAKKLGIEALKRVQSLEKFWYKDINLKLPGATEE